MLLLLATFTTVEIRFEFWNNDFYGAEKKESLLKKRLFTNFIQFQHCCFVDSTVK